MLLLCTGSQYNEVYIYIHVITVHRTAVQCSIFMWLLCTGPQYNEEGDIIISEEEFLEIKKLKDLKIQYKSNFDELKNLKSEVQYCQRLVDQARQRLIQGETFNNFSKLNVTLIDW